MKNLNGLWRLLSFLVPVPEGYAVYLSVSGSLGWDLIPSAISASIVALTGFFAIDVTNRMSEHNDILKPDEKKFKAPTWRGILVLIIWFAGVTMITVFLEVAPFLKIWTPLALVLIGSSAAWLRSIDRGQAVRESELHAERSRQASIESQHEQELLKIEEQRTAALLQEDIADRQLARKLRQEKESEKKAARKDKQVVGKRVATIRQAIASRQQAPASDSGGSVAVQKIREGKINTEKLIMAYTENPTASSTALAVMFGVERQAIEQKRNKLAVQGLIQLVKDSRGRVISVSTEKLLVGEQ